MCSAYSHCIHRVVLDTIKAIMFEIFVISILLQFTSIHGLVSQSRIVNGFASNPRDFPFYVHLTSVDKSAKSLGDCGATLLSDR